MLYYPKVKVLQLINGIFMILIKHHCFKLLINVKVLNYFKNQKFKYLTLFL